VYWQVSCWISNKTISYKIKALVIAGIIALAIGFGLDLGGHYTYYQTHQHKLVRVCIGRVGVADTGRCLLAG
jgi:hypothetical protein